MWSGIFLKFRSRVQLILNKRSDGSRFSPRNINPATCNIHMYALAPPYCPAERRSPLIGRPYINMDLNKCMNKALQQWCSWLRINGQRRSNRWIQGFSKCVTRTGRESESHTFPSCDWGSCTWWWAFNCPCHSSDAALWPADQARQIFSQHEAKRELSLPAVYRTSRGWCPPPTLHPRPPSGVDDITLTSHVSVTGVTSRAGVTVSGVSGARPRPAAFCRRRHRVTWARGGQIAGEV